MLTLKARVLSVLQLQPRRAANALDAKDSDTRISVWRLQVSYSGPEIVYEVQLREPLKSLASRQPVIGLNGFAEFNLFSQPHIAAGDFVEIDVYKAGEKILGGNYVNDAKGESDPRGPATA